MTPVVPSFDFRIIVPARYASTRLPGKLLTLLDDKPLLAHTLERAEQSSASDIIVATDDDRVYQLVRQRGSEALMTSPAHTSGTDRIAEAARALSWSPDTIVVNLQGDEPLMPPRHIDRLALALFQDDEAQVATLAAPITSLHDLHDPTIVKVTVDVHSRALYFSRAPIPYYRDLTDSTEPNFGSPVPCLQHLGLYAYRVGTLEKLSKFEPTGYERIERLEQLRALSNRIPIHVTVVEAPPSPGVDTPEDLERVRHSLQSST